MGTVSLQGIEKFYGNTKVVHGVDLHVNDGEFLVFVGPSGCGKSTILRMIAGLEDISGGTLAIDGLPVNDVPPAKRGTAMVFQNYALYPHMTVAENMGFALKLAGTPKDSLKTSVGRAAEILRISHLLERKPKALSGGERQRVAIGRAIVRKPAVFLFDEPLSNLDAALRVQMRLELSSLHRELGTTMIYVTHDQVEAMTMGDRIAVFNSGRIEQVGAPLHLYERPANKFVAGFLGSPRMNFLPCELVSAEPSRVTVSVIKRLPLSLNMPKPSSKPTALGVRPEHVEVVGMEEGVPASVELLEHLGDVTIGHFRVPETELLLAVKLPVRRAAALEVGMRVGLKPDVAHCVLFDADGRACHG
ncbi:ABC transporter ATP-binding protein [Piscinibacter terrae]|uniref:sn-glycerol-3-phosphate ABC transporter ATP-binding protein UgpC n=1 Tax=Piscinibacter terrae TaxID=2496871 RepID=A0A3N7HLT4_9BURK|nr:sn-glycerol-3-phosphate ABC transporter ATP-binding protein UgpC [Albitalea terrae]RQP23098.1 sn-glycerol-3-phosphate ABC transporter ATP-binding protein UgpC [Albitalea terrae]